MRALLALALVTLVLGCEPPPNIVGDGSLAVADREVEGAFAVRLALPAALEVVVGSPSALRLEGEENLLPYVTAEVKDGVLTLGVAPDVTLTPTRPMRLVLTVPALRGLATVSAGSITAPTLTAADFSLEIASAGSIRVAKLEAARLETTIRGPGDVRVDAGRVGHHELRMKSSGSVTALGLESTTAGVTHAGSGNAWLWVTDALGVTLTGRGSVRYLGAPTLTTHSTSTGTVEPMTDAVP